MTPNRIQEIFTQRGYDDAHAAAAACMDKKLQALVERLEKERCSAPLRPGKTARDRASGATARAAANRQQCAAENRQRAFAHVGGKGKKSA